jgi:hypothetical protein
VFHHEPIWHWHDLAQQHNEILKAIFWIEPAAQDFVRMLDRFPSIHAQGFAQMDVALQKFC